MNTPRKYSRIERIVSHIVDTFSSIGEGVMQANRGEASVRAMGYYLLRPDMIPDNVASITDESERKCPRGD